MSKFLELATRKIKHLMTRGDSGQTLVEYGLIIALIGVASIVGVALVADQVDSLWGGIASDVAAAVANVLSP